MTTASEVFLTHRRRKGREELKTFAALITTPANLVTGFRLPGNADVVISTSSVLAVSTALIVIGTHTLGSPAAAANAKYHVGYFETGKLVSKAGGAPGTVSVFVRDALGKTYLIAQG